MLLSKIINYIIQCLILTLAVTLPNVLLYFIIFYLTWKVGYGIVDGRCNSLFFMLIF